MKPSEFVNKPELTHDTNCPYNMGHDCTCGKQTKTHSMNCGYNMGHDCDCGLDESAQVNEMSPAQQARMTAMREITQKMQDVNTIFSTSKDELTKKACRTKLAQLAAQKQKLKTQPVEEEAISEKSSMSKKQQKKWNLNQQAAAAAYKALIGKYPDLRSVYEKHAKAMGLSLGGMQRESQVNEWDRVNEPKPTLNKVAAARAFEELMQKYPKLISLYMRQAKNLGIPVNAPQEGPVEEDAESDIASQLHRRQPKVQVATHVTNVNMGDGKQHLNKGTMLRQATGSNKLYIVLDNGKPTGQIFNIDQKNVSPVGAEVEEAYGSPSLQRYNSMMRDIARDTEERDPKKDSLPKSNKPTRDSESPIHKQLPVEEGAWDNIKSTAKKVGQTFTDPMGRAKAEVGKDPEGKLWTKEIGGKKDTRLQPKNKYNEADLSSAKEVSGPGARAMDETENCEIAYMVYRKGGPMGDQYLQSKNGVPTKEFDDLELAKAFAKKRNAQTSPGEKHHYSIRYHVKPIAKKPVGEAFGDPRTSHTPEVVDEILLPFGTERRGVKEDASAGGCSAGAIACAPAPNLLAKKSKTTKRHGRAYQNTVEPSMIKRSAIGTGIYESEWKQDRLKGCKCPTPKCDNSKCPIHGSKE